MSEININMDALAARGLSRSLLAGYPWKTGDAHVWQFDLPSFDSQLFEPFLCVDEIVKSRTYRFDADRARFIKSRGLLRYLLGIYLEKHPHEIVFSYTEQGKPYVSRAVSKTPLYFNISHSADVLFCAFSQDGEVGIDVEWIDEGFDWEPVLECFYTLAEAQELRSYLPEEQRKAFFQSWTQKEALIKAIGGELSEELTQRRVVSKAEAARKIMESKNLLEEERELKSINLPAFPGYVASLVAKKTAAQQIIFFDSIHENPQRIAFEA